MSYTSDQVVKVTGITYRQLDHWCRMGYVDLLNRTPGSGSPRHFTDAQLSHLATVKALVDAGINTRTAAHIAHNTPQYEHGPVQIQIDTQAIRDTLRKALA